MAKKRSLGEFADKYEDVIFVVTGLAIIALFLGYVFYAIFL